MTSEKMMSDLVWKDEIGEAICENIGTLLDTDTAAKGFSKSFQT